MDNDRATATYWVTAIVVVLAIVAAVWWYTASVSPGVPNTGSTTDTSGMSTTSSMDSSTNYVNQ